jgi:hypothetical protein
MDPNLFHLDWGRTFEALVGIVVLSFLIERALAVIFESRWYIGKIHGENQPRGKGFKELIALAVSIAICIAWKFDAISIIFLSEKITIAGSIITGGVIAGGSKASIKLFKEMMGFMSDAEASRKKIDKYASLKVGQTVAPPPADPNPNA